LILLIYIITINATINGKKEIGLYTESVGNNGKLSKGIKKIDIKNNTVNILFIFKIVNF